MPSSNSSGNCSCSNRALPILMGMGVGGSLHAWRCRSKYTTVLLVGPGTPLDTVASSMPPVGAERADTRTGPVRSSLGASSSSRDMGCSSRTALWWAKRWLRKMMSSSA